MGVNIQEEIKRYDLLKHVYENSKLGHESVARKRRLVWIAALTFTILFLGTIAAASAQYFSVLNQVKLRGKAGSSHRLASQAA